MAPSYSAATTTMGSIHTARDRDALWLREFCQRHITAADPVENALPREAPLVRLRQRLSVILEKIAALERHAAELGALERRLADSAEPSVDIARLAVQLERKRAACAALQRDIETQCTPRPVGIPLEELCAIESHACRVQAKQRGRRIRMRRLRAEAAIARGLNAMETVEAVGVNAVDNQQTSMDKADAPPDQIDMETLIAVRRAWDVYLAPPHIIGATSIPPHFVVPPSQPADAWQPFLVGQDS
ncbi:hypothetical protein PINS_up009964 [Pythium insidiosum]|nr:hypothetical protein PINS_up009964 [Pythium insidiosum]